MEVEAAAAAVADAQVVVVPTVVADGVKIDYDFGLEDPKDKDFQYFLDLVEIIDKKIQDIIYF